MLNSLLTEVGLFYLIAGTRAGGDESADLETGFRFFKRNFFVGNLFQNKMNILLSETIYNTRLICLSVVYFIYTYYSFTVQFIYLFSDNTITN